MKLHELTENMKGRNFSVVSIGSGRVKKTPLAGGKITPIEYKKLEFMRANAPSKLFVPIYELTDEYVIMQQVDVAKAATYINLFANSYFDMVGDDDIRGEDGDLSIDGLGEFIMNQVLSPNSTMDWSSCDDIITNHASDPSIRNFKIAYSYIRHYRKKLAMVHSWPVSVFDIHIDNIGLSPDNAGLMIFDF